MDSKNKILFFLPKNTMNEATIFYVDIIKKAYEKIGFRVFESDDFKDIFEFNNIFVMSAKWFFLIKLMKLNSNVVTWFQGLGGEEALMTRNSSRDKFFWSVLEFFALKYSFFIFFVSIKMRDYYFNRFSISNVSNFIMPCFNKNLNYKALNFSHKKNDLSFVYAGGLDKWQCIEKTLTFFREIEVLNPNAVITLLTRDVDQALTLLNKYKIENGFAKFVKLEDLDSELVKYKYGFLIREDHIVNNVSTPTKMSSYLANGVIPIYTNVIDDFELNLKSNYFLKLKANSDVDSWVDAFFKHDLYIKENIHLLKDDIVKIFNSYYSRSFYIDKLSCSLSDLY